MLIFLDFFEGLEFNSNLWVRFETELLNEGVSHFFVGSLRLLSYYLIDANRKIFQTFGVFLFLYFFTLWRWWVRLKVPLFLFLNRQLFLFKFLFFTKQTCIVLEFESSSDWLYMLFGNFTELSILGIELKIIGVLTWGVEGKKEHRCFWTAIKRTGHLLHACPHLVWLVRWFVV